MWLTVYNPLEGVIAPVVRGNPWGWDEAPASDDWVFVTFDWDTSFAAYVLPRRDDQLWLASAHVPKVADMAGTCSHSTRRR